MEEDLGPLGLSEPMPCYEFNERLASGDDDGSCARCRKFLTTECEYIDHFLEEEETE